MQLWKLRNNFLPFGSQLGILSLFCLEKGHQKYSNIRRFRIFRLKINNQIVWNQNYLLSSSSRLFVELVKITSFVFYNLFYHQYLKWYYIKDLTKINHCHSKTVDAFVKICLLNMHTHDDFNCWKLHSCNCFNQNLTQKTGIQIHWQQVDWIRR